MANNNVVATLKFLLNGEITAADVYSKQLWLFRNEKEICKMLRKAAENERNHIAGLTLRLLALGGSPSQFRSLFNLFGTVVFGFGSLFLGRRLAMKLDIWIEGVAIDNYDRALNNPGLDDETRLLLERYRQDEKQHVRAWQHSLEILSRRRLPANQSD